MTPTARELQRLVAFPSVSSEPIEPIAAYVAQRCEDLGMRVERFPTGEPGKHNLVATAGPAGTDGLVLSGHLDVVPVDGQPWSHDPFDAVVRDGHMYGRGTADMKGFVAATLVALRDLDLTALRRELVLIWTCDEEVGCQGSGHLVHGWDPARPLPSACLIGEPTGFRVLRMHPGHVRVRVDAHGEAAHTSRPDLGHNAIELAAQVVAVVASLAAELRDEAAPDLPVDPPWVPLVAAQIRGGTAINIVPDHCTVDIGYRPLPGQPARAVFERLRDRLLAEVDAPERLTIATGTITPAMLTPDGTSLARWLHDHAEPGGPAAPFATDGGHLARLGMQPLIFGPGAIDVAHKADEHVAVDELIRCRHILRSLVTARCVG